MSYLFKIDKNNFSYQNDDLDEYKFEELHFFTKNLNKDEIQSFATAYKENKLNDLLNKFGKYSFILIFFDNSKKYLYVYNDHFSSNEIFYYSKDDLLTVFNNIKEFCRKQNYKISIDIDRIHELIVFQTIMPPNSVYKNIMTIPMGSYLFYGDSKLETKDYWRVVTLFKKKEKDYGLLIKRVQDALGQVIKDKVSKNSSISLSGGIDSGGLLGIITKILDDPIPSITLGAYGPETEDLKNSRKSAKYNNSENYEIYPEYQDLLKLRKYLKGLNQPVDGHLLLPNCLILDKASEIKLDKIFYGFGSEMLAGNLKICKIAYYLSVIEKIIPFFLLKYIYLFISNIFKLSKNQKEFLLSRSWIDRFLHARGPLYTYEKKYFKDHSNDFISDAKKKFSKILNYDLNLNDKLVLFYLFGWVNYMQKRDFAVMSRMYDIYPIMPFDSLCVVNELFKISNKYRKLNKWNKQVLRDIFKPYITEELYIGKAKSLIFPYNKWFNLRYKTIIKYLRTSDIITKAIDLDKYEKEFFLPEPGLNLMRLLSVAVWYDVNWNKKNIENFNKYIVN